LCYFDHQLHFRTHSICITLEPEQSGAILFFFLSLFSLLALSLFSLFFAFVKIFVFLLQFLNYLCSNFTPSGRWGRSRRDSILHYIILKEKKNEEYQKSSLTFHPLSDVFLCHVYHVCHLCHHLPSAIISISAILCHLPSAIISISAILAYLHSAILPFCHLFRLSCNAFVEARGSV